MTNQHPITPPIALIDQWWNEAKQNAKYDEPIGPLKDQFAAPWSPSMTDPNYKALCAELVDALLCWQTDGAWIDQAEQSRLIARARAALAQPVALELSPREVEAQDAFTQMRDVVLKLSDGLEVNEVLGIIDDHTPEWV
jgi:Zn-finger nucleic acid-binding protein